MTRFGSRFAALLLALSTSGCIGGGVDQTGISDSLKVAVLVDVYTATAKARLDGTDPESARIGALSRHHLDTLSLNAMIDYFAENPDSATDLYQQALDSLVILQREMKSSSELDSLAARLRR